MANYSSHSANRLSKHQRSGTVSTEGATLGHVKLKGKSKPSCRLVALSHSFKAWKRCRENGKWKNAELATHLIDVHEKFCMQPECVSSTESSPDQSHAHALSKVGDLCHPIHKKERGVDNFKASDAADIVDGKENWTLLPNPVQNPNLIASDVESNATSVSIDTVSSSQEDTTENFDIGRERGKARCGLVALSYSFKAWKTLREKCQWNDSKLAAHLLELHSQFCKQPRCVSSEPSIDQPNSLSNACKRTVRKDSLHQGESMLLDISDQTIKKEKEEGYTTYVKFGTAQGRMDLDESTRMESVESYIKVEDDSDQEREKNDWVVKVGIDFICTDEDDQKGDEDDHHHDVEDDVNDDDADDDNNGDDDGDDDYEEDVCSTEEGMEVMEEKQQQGHQVTDRSNKRFDRPKLEKLSICLKESLERQIRRQNFEFTEVPFQSFDIGEVARAEGFTVTSTKTRRLKKLYWTELERVYQCRICWSEDSTAYSICHHLLQKHTEVVGDLENYLKESPAAVSEPGRTLYDMVMEVPAPNDSVDKISEGSELCDGIETGMKAIRTKAEDDSGRHMSDNQLDSRESVDLLSRWIKIWISCQFCQKKMNCRLFTPKGERIIHKCGSSKSVRALCEICGKSVVSFRAHWLQTHANTEAKACPHCGKKSLRLKQHIARCHSSKKDQFQCEVCKKGFKLQRSLNKHMVTHMKEKPYKCTYCQRGFSQSSNMKYHMRQHTGEKPYKCSKCSQSFTHNVSRKNHLKSKHGIDPWKEDPAGD